MPSNASSALRLFVDRLRSHSIVDPNEQAAVLDLRTQEKLVCRSMDFVDYGQAVRHCCLVAEGLVGAFGPSRDGGRQITAFFVPGDMVDLRSVVVPKSGQALQALCPTTILRIAHADVRELLARNPALGEAFWRDTIVDAEVLAQWVVNVGSRDAVTRMAHVVCELGLRMERAGQGSRTRFPMQMTQTHLGEVLGLTAVHVNRTLRTLREQGLVSIEKKDVVVPNWDRLADVGEFDASYLKLGGEPLHFGWFDVRRAAAGASTPPG